MKNPALFRLTLVLAACLLPGPVSAQIASNRSDDLVYHFFAEPARAEVYDLASEEWLDPIPLPEKPERLTSGFVDSDGIYLAYGTAIYRYGLDADEETLVSETDHPVTVLHTDDSVLFAVESENSYSEANSFRSFSKASNSALDLRQGFGFELSTLEFDVSKNGIQYMDFRSLRTLAYDADGYFGDIESQSFTAGDPFSGPTRSWLEPGGELVIGNRGGVFDGFDFNEFARLPIEPDLVAFRDANTFFIAKGSRVSSLDATYRVRESMTLPFEIGEFHQYGEKLFAFGASSTSSRGVAAEALSFDELDVPASDAPRDPSGLAYEPEYAFLDNRGIVHLFSRKFRCLFRWDPVTQTYLDSINFEGVPWYVAYSPSLNRVYISYQDGTVEQADLPPSGNLRPSIYLSFTRPGPVKVTPAGPYVFAEDTFRIRAYDAQGNETDDINLGASNLFWDPEEQRVYGIDYSRGGMAPFRASTRSHRSLSLGHFGDSVGNTSISSSRGGVAAITPDGSGIVSLEGDILDARTLQLQPEGLENTFLDGAAIGSRLYTIRTISGTAQFQRWSGSDYRADIVREFPESRGSILLEVDGQPLGITIADDGTPNFYLMDSEFGIAPPPELARPDGLRVSIEGAETATVSWIDVSGEEGYRVERRASEGEPWTTLAVTDTGLNQYTDATLTAGNDYEFRVVAMNGDLESEPSEPALVSIRAPGEVPGFAAGSITESSIDLSWETIPFAEEFELEYSPVDTPWSTRAQTLSATTTSATADDLYPFTTYRFRIRAVNGVDKGPVTTLEATTLPALPAAPGQFRLDYQTSYSIGLQWYTAAGSEYIVERRLPAGDWSVVATLAADNPFNDRFVDEDVTPDTTYLYRVKARNSRGESDYTQSLEVVSGSLVAPPRPSLALSHLHAGGVRVAWTIDAPTAESIVIERRVDTETWKLVAEVPASDADSYEDHETSPGYRYEYRIKAVNSAGDSEYRAYSIHTIDGICLIEEDYDDGIGSPWTFEEGAELVMDGGEGFPHGGVLLFNGGLWRSLETEPVDLRLGGTLSLRLRAGNSDAGESTRWDRPESGENIFFQYETADGQWQNLANFSGEELSEWQTRNIRIPAIDAGRSTRLRIIQFDFSGRDYDTWAIDSFCLLGHRPENQPPEFADDTPRRVTANATADPVTLHLGDYVSDPNRIDTTYFSIAEVSNPDIFTRFEIDLETGRLDLEFDPRQIGTSALVIEATDEAGASSTREIEVNLPVLPEPVIVREGLVTFDSDTGLYKQSVTIANNGTRPVAGFRVRVTGLEDGYSLYGFPDGMVLHEEDVPPGESITMNLEYHSSDSRSGPQPDFEIDLLYPNPAPEEVPGQGDASLVMMRDEARVFAFEAAVGARYRIQYSEDMQEWRDSPGIVTAGANRVRWIDQGPPKTDCHPAECPTRYYRAVRLDGE